VHLRTRRKDKEDGHTNSRNKGGIDSIDIRGMLSTYFNIIEAVPTICRPSTGTDFVYPRLLVVGFYNVISTKGHWERVRDIRSYIPISLGS
jgi:hypothetical protein